MLENAVRVDGTAHRGLLDLNHATAEDLESLPGRGHVLDQRVITFLKSVGRFQVVAELREVKGVNLETFERIKPLVMVAAPDSKGKAENRPL